tara:strand:- start:1282 stop:1443 length:162 start_codon:yes stop_codon:yes gene_type:complete
MKTGDKIRITMVDGEILEGTFIAYERGFYILKDANGQKRVCRDSSITFKEVIE